ncbi:MAG: type II toxin-antitoxin system VapC family toxin [Bradymonadaceae bacterium]
MTSMTAGELYYGAAKSNATTSNRRLVDEFLATVELFTIGRPAAREFGRLKASLEERGDQLADVDLLVAAVALVDGAIAVTGNRRHYDRVSDLEVEDWIRGGE